MFSFYNWDFNEEERETLYLHLLPVLEVDKKNVETFFSEPKSGGATSWLIVTSLPSYASLNCNKSYDNDFIC